MSRLLNNIPSLIPVYFILALVASMLTAGEAHAEPAISCHCFQDRSFDPANPSKVDPYLLATAQNGLLATVYGIEKRTIVQQKMSGADGEELWVIYRLALSARKSPDEVQEQFQQSNGWRKTARALGIDPESIPPAVWLAILRDATTAEIAQAIVDDILIRQLRIDHRDVEQRRAAGAGSKELILAALIQLRNGGAIGSVLKQAKSGVSWGELAGRVGITGESLKVLIPALLQEGGTRN